MTLKIMAASLTTAVAIAAATASVAVANSGDPQNNGCPSGMDALNVVDLSDQGYRVPAIIDSLANGGNGDGVICTQPWTSAEQDARVPGTDLQIYSFRDNNLPPYTH
jgi:hypothetical protein